MGTHEARYRQELQSTRNLIVAFFDSPEGFDDALESIRRQIACAQVEPDRCCILYRTLCDSEGLPRLRVWSHPVPFEALKPPSDNPVWLGLDREHKRAMTSAECSAFFREKRYEVVELRVSKRDPSPSASASGASSVSSSSSRSNGYLDVASTVTSSSGIAATRSRNL